MRSRSADAAFAKALTLWEAPEQAEEARVCVASTFTFDAAFFETECLGRFLHMDSHPSESESVAYLVEREEKLAGAHVSVLVDRRHARDKESLRWDVLGVLVPRAIQHAKVALLAWANCIRVVITSANLTEPGYRRNLEVCGAFDVTPNDGDAATVVRTIDFLEAVLERAVGRDGDDTPRARTRRALASVRHQVTGWGESGSRIPRKNAVFGSPGQSVLTQLGELWPSSAPAREAFVVSPFFDCDGAHTETANGLLRCLAQRGDREIYLDVPVEDRPDGTLRVFAPRGLISQLQARANVSVRPVLREQQGELRDLHAKMVYLTNGEWTLLLAGSSNFTAAGMGAPEGRNFEANIVYRLRTSESDAKAIDAVWPEVGDELNLDATNLIWDPGDNEEGTGDVVPLPGCFQDAIFAPGPKDSSLSITLVNSLPKSWSVNLPDGECILDSSVDRPARTHLLPWTRSVIPFVLEVTWITGVGVAVANWPVNVSNPAELPPPEVLRGLTLEELLEILSSTRPLPEATRRAIEKRSAGGKGGDHWLDPLKRFNSHAFLLRRTRRVAVALERLRERLERPALTREAFEWRLNGPLGAMALADAFCQDSVLPGEGKFYLAELALALRRAQPARAAAGGISSDVAQECLNGAIGAIHDRVASQPHHLELDAYVAAALQKAAV